MSVFRPNLFSGHVAIVTGGGTGIGKSIVTELLSLGCKVVIAARNADRLNVTARELSSEFPAAHIKVFQCNIRKEEEVRSLVDFTVKTFGRFDFLVNNGGGQFMSLVEDMTAKGWNAVVDTNLNGTFLVCKEAFHGWMAQHGGVIVNIIADMWKGFPMMAHTGAARAAVDNLTKSLSIEWADRGIRINAVAPGTIFSETAAANYPEGVWERAVPRIPLKRVGTTDEVAAAVCFLLSPAASFITGETLKIDGGSSLYASIWDVPEHNTSKPYERKKQLPIGDTKSKL